MVLWFQGCWFLFGLLGSESRRGDRAVGRDA